MDRATAQFLAQVPSAPLPPEDYPLFGTLAQAKANAELQR